MKREVRLVDIQAYLDNKSVHEFVREITTETMEDIRKASVVARASAVAESIGKGKTKTLVFDKKEVFIEVVSCVRQMVLGIRHSVWWDNLSSKDQLSIIKSFIGVCWETLEVMPPVKKSAQGGQQLKEVKPLDELAVYFDTPDSLFLALDVFVMMLETLKSTNWWRKLSSTEKGQRVTWLTTIIFLSFANCYWDVFQAEVASSGQED